MPVLAAIDIGSNSVRLSIAEVHRGKLKVLHTDREVTRLGEGVFRNGSLDPQAMALTVKVLQRFRKSIQDYGADKIRVVATSATRDAKNSRVFSEWVRSATGWRIEVITGLEEGRLIHLGVVSNTTLRASRVLLLDLGGGSCELTLSVDGHIREMVSVPLGAVRLTQEFLRHDPPKAKEVERLREFAREELDRVVEKVLAAKPRVTIATSGTADALAGAARSLHKKMLRVSTSRADVQKLAQRLAKLALDERKKIPGINAKRAEIIVAGAVVFSEVMERCHLPTFRYLPLGLRDGLLAQMAADYGSHLVSRKQIQADRWDAVLATCRHYSVDVNNATHVRNLAESLFEPLKRLHGTPAEFKDWLCAAAMLQEVGQYINRTGRNRHSYYVISNTEIFGYAPQERWIIAAIARFQGSSKPQLTDRPMKRIPAALRQHTIIAILILRLARALNQGRRMAVRDVKVRVGEAEVELILTVGRAGADLELWAAEKEISYFREVLGRELLLKAS